MSSIRIWQITSNRSIQIEFPHHSSLDAITRQLPDGYYSTFRTFGNGTRVVGLKTHLQRLYHPVHSPDASEAKLREQLAIFLASYSHEARVRVIMTKQGQLYVMIESLKKLAPEIYEYGVRVETTEMARSTPRLKTTAFISASEDERKHIAHEGIFEALMVKNGEIIEGMTSNFFYILHPERSREAAKSKDTADGAALRLRSEVLCTAQRDILLGVTRRMVLRVARASRLEVRYQPLKRDQLEVSREAFITSSSRGVVPVVQIDNLIVGDGRPGQITKQLSAAYEAYVIKKAEII